MVGEVEALRSYRADVSFLARALRALLRGPSPACPFCAESRHLELLGTKKLLLRIFRCNRCLLIFRYPQDGPDGNQDYYQGTYHSGPVTELPSGTELADSLKFGFKGQLDHSRKHKLLKALKPSGKILDYGCSWGYGVHQLESLGYEAIGFEISKPRAAYGRIALGVHIIDELGEVRRLPAGSFDAIFTNHVIEHLPDLRESFDMFNRLLRDDGLLLNILPNFGSRLAMGGAAFWNIIGRDHPLAPTRAFFELVLPSNGFRQIVCGSGPFDENLVSLFAQGQFGVIPADGEELFVAAWKEQSGVQRAAGSPFQF
jgi:SAM-dependent methyltransferase